MPYNNGSGSTAGTAITTANSGGASGDAFNAVSSVAPLWATSMTGPYPGIGRPMQFNASDQAQYVQITSGITGLIKTMYLSFYFRYSAVTSTTTIANLRSGSSGSQMLRIALDTARHIRLFGYNNASLYTGVAGSELPTDQWLFFTLVAEAGGSVRVKLRVTTMSGTIVEDISLTGVATAHSGTVDPTFNAIRIGTDVISGSYSQFFVYEPRAYETNAYGDFLTMPPRVNAELRLFAVSDGATDDPLSVVPAFLPGAWTPSSQMISPSNQIVQGVWAEEDLWFPTLTTDEMVMVTIITGENLFIDEYGIANAVYERFDETGTTPRSVGQAFTSYDAATKSAIFVTPISKDEGGQMVRLTGSSGYSSGDGEGVRMAVMYIVSVNPGNDPLRIYLSHGTNTTGFVSPNQRENINGMPFPADAERMLYNNTTLMITKTPDTAVAFYYDVLRPSNTLSTGDTHNTATEHYSIQTSANLHSWLPGGNESWYSSQPRESWVMWEFMVPIQGVLEADVGYVVGLVADAVTVLGRQNAAVTVGLQAQVKQEFAVVGTTPAAVGLLGASRPSGAATASTGVTVGLVGTASAVSSLGIIVGLVGTVRITGELPITVPLLGSNGPAQVDAVLEVVVGLRGRLTPPPFADPLEDVTLTPLDYDVTLTPIQDFEVV